MIVKGAIAHPKVRRVATMPPPPPPLVEPMAEPEPEPLSELEMPEPPIETRSAHQLARPGDPETSHEAAAAILSALRELQERVLAQFRRHGPMHQHVLIARYRAVHGHTPESTIRTRCAELVDAKLLMDTGERVVLPSGRRAIVWQCTEKGTR